MINSESHTLIRRAVFALAIGVLSCATVLAQQVDISDADALRRFAPELTDSEVGFQLTETQQRLVANRIQGLGYRFDKDLNADGRPDVVLLGHGRKNGTSQSFVLILTKEKGGAWIRSKIFTFSQPYLIGEISQKGLNVYFCESCDRGGRVTWTGSDYQFTPF